MYSSYVYVIVVGSQRSGTTLAAQIIGAHPQAIVIDEDDGLYQWTEALLNQQPNNQALFLSVLQRAQNKYKTPLERFTVEGKPRSEISTIVLKAPNLTYEWDRLSKVLPDAKIIYLHREVRAIVTSMIKLSSIPIVDNQLKKICTNRYILRRFPKELELLQSKDVADYKKMALIALIKMSFVTEFNTAGFSVTKISYEDLVCKTKSTVSNILIKTGLSINEECYNYHMQYRGYGPGKTDRTKSISDKSLYLWNSVLSNKEIIDIEEIEKEFYALRE